MEGMFSENLEDSGLKLGIISVTWKMRITVFKDWIIEEMTMPGLTTWKVAPAFLPS